MLTLLYFRGGSPAAAAAVEVAAPSGGVYYLKRRRSLKEHLDELVARIGEIEEPLVEAAREVVAEQAKADTPIARMGAPKVARLRAATEDVRALVAQLEARAIEDDDEEVLLLAA